MFDEIIYKLLDKIFSLLEKVKKFVNGRNKKYK